MSALAVLIALPVSAAAIWVLLHSPLRQRLLVAPSGDRWHTRETPIGGGIGIALGFAAGVGAAVASGYIEADTQLLGILAGCGILFAAGLVDDFVNLPPAVKLVAQIGAAVLVMLTGTNVEIVGNDILAFAIGLLWLVGLTNAFNLLDNMDGLAATLATIACAFFAIDAATTHENHLVLAISVALGLGCAGFLPYNLRPGRKALVFMGDSGSQLLGFALAVLGLAASYTAASATVATLLLPVLILAVPILDTTLVTVVRLLDGRPVYEGGRDHSSHRLVYLGLSETSAVVLLALVSIALGATSLAYTTLGNGRIAAVGVLITFALLVQFGSFLADIDREGRIDRRTCLLRPSRAPRPGADRRRADRRRLPLRLSAPLRGHGHVQPAALLPGLPAGAPLRALRRLHPVRPLPRRLALRRLSRRGRGGRRRGALGVRGRRVHHADAAAVRRLLAERLRDRRVHLQRADRRLALRRAGARPRPDDHPRPRTGAGR